MSSQIDTSNVTNHTLSVLPLRDLVVFPNMIFPLFIGRKKSLRSLEYAMTKNAGKILIVAQKEQEKNDLTFDDIYKVGVEAKIVQLIRLKNNNSSSGKSKEEVDTIKILVETTVPYEIVNFYQDDCFKAEVEKFDYKKDDSIENDIEKKGILNEVITQFNEYSKLNKKVSEELLHFVTTNKNIRTVVERIASVLTSSVSEKQEVLEATSDLEALYIINKLLLKEIEVVEMEKRINERVKEQMRSSHKQYVLNEQLKAIKKELGSSSDHHENNEDDEITRLGKEIEKAKMPKEASDRAKDELRKLASMNPSSSEANIVRNYIDWLISLPWKKNTKLLSNINESEKILDTAHYGLDKIKEKILEFIAVQNRTKSLSGPILCLVGPPGVGKTSLASSIAEAMGRNFIKLSLGGVRDEAEIRGHRRTYIGAMPGKIIQSMKKAKSANPLFLLDEIDKLGADYRGDPSAALLEVLDPEQNKKFNDHYLEVDYDLSNVMFVATANSLQGIPHPLRDRMEIIHISSYTENEKLEIAKRHLITKQRQKAGLKEEEFELPDSVIREIIVHYTYEAGVRNLERQISSLCRKVVKKLSADGKTKKISITKSNLSKFLGIHKHTHGVIEEKDLVGVTTGLAYTDFGGDILTIEAVRIPGGNGKVEITGKLGEVMQESIKASYSYVKSRTTDFGVAPTEHSKYDIHIHVPEGATPKDGPSAGIAISTTLISLITGIPVNRKVAMTGEITLRGRVLPIGGLKEKLLAAIRGGIETVLIPEKNNKDLSEIEDNIKNKLNIILVSRLDDVIKEALVRQPKPIIWSPELDNIPQSSINNTQAKTGSESGNIAKH